MRASRVSKCVSKRSLFRAQEEAAGEAAGPGEPLSKTKALLYRKGELLAVGATARLSSGRRVHGHLQQEGSDELGGATSQGDVRRAEPDFAARLAAV